MEGNSICSAAFCESAALRGHPFRHRLRRCHLLPTLSLTRHLSPAGESLSKGTASALLGAFSLRPILYGVRPLSQALSGLTALPKGEPRALPETSSLHLTL